MLFGWKLVLHAARAMADNAYIEMFLWVVIADLFTGIVKSFITHAKVNSSTGVRGLAKHLLIMFSVLTVYPILEALQFDTISNAVAFFIS